MSGHKVREVVFDLFRSFGMTTIFGVKAGPTLVDFMGGVHLWYKDRRGSTRPSTIISTVGTHGVR
jgi:hypothetical protein